MSDISPYTIQVDSDYDSMVKNNDVEQLMLHLNEQNCDIRSILYYGIRHNRINILKILTDMYDIRNIKAWDEYVLNIILARIYDFGDYSDNFIPMMQFFIDIGIDITIRHNHYVRYTLTNGLFIITKFLLDNDADINDGLKRDFEYNYADWMSAIKDAIDGARFILTITQLVADYGLDYQYNNNVLFNKACKSNCMPYVIELVNLGVSVNTLHIHTISGIITQNYYDVMDLLLKNGLDIMLINPVSVIKTNINGNTEMVSLLISYGFNFSLYKLSVSEASKSNIDVLLNTGIDPYLLLCILRDEMVKML